MFVGLTARAQDVGPPQAPEKSTVVDQSVAIFDDIANVLEEKHLQPPTRQEMASSAVRFAQATTGVAGPTPHELALLASQLDRDSVQGFVREHVQRMLEAGAPAEGFADVLAQGLLAATADSARWIPAEAWRVERQLNDNQYVGIGVALHFKSPHSIFGKVFRRGSALRAGVLEGDRLLQVDGDDTEGKPVADVVRLLRGPRGSEVVLRVAQPNEPPRELRMVRDVVPIDSVKGARLDEDDRWATHLRDSYHYLKVGGLVGSTAAELRTLALAMQNASAAGVVLDLRQAGNGDIDHLRHVADAWLAAAIIGRFATNSETQELKTTEDHVLHDVPLVVLVDESSQPAAHGLAYVLKKHRPRTEVLGSLQLRPIPIRAVVPVPDGGGVELTVGVLRFDEAPHSIGSDPAWRSRPVEGRGFTSTVDPEKAPPAEQDVAVRTALTILQRMQAGN